MIKIRSAICRMAAFVALFSLAFATTAQAGVVTVSMVDSSVVFTGQLVGEDADTIVLETRYGTVVLAKAESKCKGCAPQIFAQAN